MINQVLAAVAAALLVGDLHTTSEIVKNGGVERNALLGWLNGGGDWGPKFWLLAALKAASATGALYVGFTQDSWFAPYGLVAFDFVYGYIVLVNNLPLYKRLKSKE